MNGREGQEDKTRALRGRVHAVELCNRETAAFTGVADVESFNEEEIVLLTDLGTIVLAGEGLHIVKLNLNDGVLEAEGAHPRAGICRRAENGQKGIPFRPVQVREKRCCLKRWDRRASFSG